MKQGGVEGASTVVRRADRVRVPRRLLAAVALVVLLGACGLPDPDEPAGETRTAGDGSPVASAQAAIPSPGVPLHQIGAGLRGAPVTFRTVVHRQVEGTPIEVVSTGEGWVDLAAGSGEAVLDLSRLVHDPAFRALRLSWDDEWLRADATGQVDEVPAVPRDEGRRDGGLLGRVPDELPEILALFERAEPTGDLPDVVEGRPVRRLTGVVELDAETATAIGAFGGSATGTAADVEAWVDLEGFARQLRASIRMEPMRNAATGAVVLGPRTHSVTYRLTPGR